MIIKHSTHSGSYAYMREELHRTQDGPDGKVYLLAPEGSEPDGDYERLPRGGFGKPVAETELESSFSITTIVFINGEAYYGGFSENSETAFVEWPKTVPLDPAGAYERGLESFERGWYHGQKPVSEIHKVLQVRGTTLASSRDWRRPPVPVREVSNRTDGPDPEPALNGLTAALKAALPEGWESVALDCRATVSYMQLATTVTVNGEEYYWSPPPEVSQWLHRLRLASYRSNTGAWFSADYRLLADGEPVVEFDFDNEPVWPHLNEFMNFDSYYWNELWALPRTLSATPDWMLRAVHRYQEELAYHGRITIENNYREKKRRKASKRKPLRLARLFDFYAEGQPPVAHRAPLPANEVGLVLDYLTNAPVVLASRGFAPDLLAPEQDAAVPMAYHTDGVWVWSASLAYYLREHRVAPPLALVTHIRDRGYEVPRGLPKMVTQEAVSVAMGMPERFPGADDDWQRAKFSVRDFAIRFSISRRHFSLGEYADQAWCLVREPDDQFSVFWWHAEEQRRELEARFDDVAQAATYLVGQLYLNYPNLQRAADEPMLPEEAPIQAMGGDPAISNYDNIDTVILPDGYEVERWGWGHGNTLFDAGTPFERSTLPWQMEEEHGRFRLTGGEWKVLGAYTRPSETQPGGARVYFLPLPIRDYLQRGLIVEIPPGEAQR